ncbi:hypothetical protein BJF85_10310 [Saccharomonospora sp. CUA-673]|uniref:murein transglycosylase n=1 Tax=Saccharomonospora sp. CUA-673 TaxID=1904969 RepID=UPI0009684999|nr:murein transglycosylase [Saccharomonospora sp. CUA-673]OLT49236.1 hypothetical protein BJF85_10310 [Saccharomonospora sp. CUA-673]
MALTFALIATGLILVFTVGTERDEEPAAEPGTREPAPEESPPALHRTLPAAAAEAPVDRKQVSDEQELDDWSRQVERATGVPARAAAAYGRAEMWLRGGEPDCHLSWSTLAAIGYVETRHGEGGSGTPIRADGRPAEPIVGPPLDGTRGRAEVADTDNGLLDGDVTWDRKLGPLGFLPEHWENAADRATRDGRPPDPQDVDDAALTAARLLCGQGRDLSSVDGWWEAVRVHHGAGPAPDAGNGPDEDPAESYGREVATRADIYGRRMPADR